MASTVPLSTTMTARARSRGTRVTTSAIVASSFNAGTITDTRPLSAGGHMLDDPLGGQQCFRGGEVVVHVPLGF